MKLLILSDLHLEFAPFELPDGSDFDVAILAGDIHCPAVKAVRWAGDVASDHNVSLTSSDTMAEHHLFGPGAHRNQQMSLERENAPRHRLHEIFSDFCELGALAISNAADLRQYEQREARYLQIVSRHEREEVEHFRPVLHALPGCFDVGAHDGWVM